MPAQSVESTAFSRWLSSSAVALQRLMPLLGWHLLVMAVLRAIWMLRPDPFGHPLVGKFDWYWFHAVGMDLQQLLIPGRYLLAILMVLALRPAVLARLLPALALAIGLLTTVVVFAAQVDLEVMRFVGTHVTWSLVTTYTGGALFHELPRLLSKDAGGPYLGLALLLIAPPAQIALQIMAWRRPQPVTLGWRQRVSPRFSVFAGGMLIAWLFTEVIWPGNARAWKVRPILVLAQTEWTEGIRPPMAQALQQRAAVLHAARWTSTNPSESQVFPDPNYPLWHLTPWQACRTPAANQAVIAKHWLCNGDADGDGTPLRDDCDDQRADIHPGAVDVPGDGIDQDCSGVDAQPWNILVLSLESHRAVSVGHVFPGIAPQGRSWSPVVDALAKQGYAQGRAVAAGIPTIGSFMALHTGLYSCVNCQVATDFTVDRLPALPATLREHGYYAQFFSAFDPAWDNQNAWLRHWYDQVDYDRSRQEDAELLDHVGDWLVNQSTQVLGGKPFFVVATTRSNHFPFPRVNGVPTTGDDSWPDRMRDTMGYTDAAVGRLIERLRSQPWFVHTIIVVTGDHGFPLGEHGAHYLHETLHIEATGVPLVLVGEHPELRSLRGVLNLEPSSHVDLAPTLLDLAGIDPSGAWMGRSLLRKSPGVAITFKDAHEAMSRGRYRILYDVPDAAHPENWQVYDHTVDPLEKQRLPAPADSRPIGEELDLTSQWMRELYTNNRVLPP